MDQDLLRQGKEAMGPVETVLASVPGIKGYKEKELRRATDKAVREHVARRLQEQQARLTNLQGDLLRSGGLSLVDDMERANTKLQLLADRVRTASYGYAPLFDLVRVKEAQLDALMAFDANLLTGVERIEAILDNMATLAGRPDSEWLEAIRALNTALDQLNTEFGRRSELITQVGSASGSAGE
ncbi:MAG: hypothetical protein RMN53_07575 [Anaerolineae bacterium]|nr:hypothetical protein [Anaerolineae bacterium]